MSLDEVPHVVDVADGRMVTVEQVSEPRPGQRFAFIMDTRLCDAAFALADQADMLVCESTFANAEDLDHIPVPRRRRNEASPPGPDSTAASAFTTWGCAATRRAHAV